MKLSIQMFSLKLGSKNWIINLMPKRFIVARLSLDPYLATDSLNNSARTKSSTNIGIKSIGQNTNIYQAFWS